MSLSPADEKLRQEQLRVLRRKWLKDQELSPREPVLPPTKLGPVERFWSNFMREKSIWRTYVDLSGSSMSVYAQADVNGQYIQLPCRFKRYFLHVQEIPYAVTFQRRALYPGDIIMETGEVIPPLEEPTSGHHHHH